jgi:hypothetical protein
MLFPPERRPLRIAKARPLAGFRHQPDCFFVDLRVLDEDRSTMALSPLFTKSDTRSAATCLI